MSTVRRRLGRADWVAEATALLAAGGLGAVAVEPLAVRLGATKGSFYWHFANREELVAAVLDRWVDEHTEEVIRRVEAVSTPADRLRTLFEDVMVERRDNDIELRLLARLDDPLVAAAMRDVTRRRVDYVASCFTDLGLDPADARRHAVLAYTTFVGMLQAEQASGGRLLAGIDRAAYLAFVEERLLIDRP